jgi:hypothetical protein
MTVYDTFENYGTTGGPDHGRPKSHSFTFPGLRDQPVQQRTTWLLCIEGAKEAGAVFMPCFRPAQRYDDCPGLLTSPWLARFLI